MNYSPRDAELCLNLHQMVDEKYVFINGLWYDRQEWERYCLEKRRWERDDPTVVVSLPVGFRYKR